MKYVAAIWMLILISPLLGMERSPRWGTEEWKKARQEVEKTIRDVEKRKKEQLREKQRRERARTDT